MRIGSPEYEAAKEVLAKKIAKHIENWDKQGFILDIRREDTVTKVAEGSDTYRLALLLTRKKDKQAQEPEFSDIQEAKAFLENVGENTFELRSTQKYMNLYKVVMEHYASNLRSIIGEDAECECDDDDCARYRIAQKALETGEAHLHRQVQIITSWQEKNRP